MKIAAYIMTLFSVVSLYSTVNVVQDPVTQKLSFNLTITNKQELEESLVVLKDLIPALYAEEIGQDSVKDEIITRFDDHLQNIMVEQELASFISAAIFQLIKAQDIKQLSLTESIVQVTQSLAVIENMAFFNCLYGFLNSTQGKNFLQVLEECKSAQLVKLPLALMGYYLLQAVDSGITQNS